MLTCMIEDDDQPVHVQLDRYFHTISSSVSGKVITPAMFIVNRKSWLRLEGELNKDLYHNQSSQPRNIIIERESEEKGWPALNYRGHLVVFIEGDNVISDIVNNRLMKKVKDPMETPYIISKATSEEE